MKQITENINHSVIGNELMELWLEYEECSSPEAEVAKNLDKFEMIVQANEYEIAQNIVLQDFFDSTKDSFTHPEVKNWADKLRADRANRLSNI